MSLGIRTIFQKTADSVFTSNATLATIGLLSPIAANQTQTIRAWIPFTVGATGGLRLQLVVPAGGVIFEATILLRDNVTPATISAVQNASAAFTNALAVAGAHWVEVNATIVNGATAGDIDLRMAQNTVDVLSLTVLRAAHMEVVSL